MEWNAQMFVVDCRRGFGSPYNNVLKNLGTSLERFVNAVIEYDDDGLDLAFTHQPTPERKLRDVKTVMEIFHANCDGCPENLYCLSDWLDALLADYCRVYDAAVRREERQKPLNMIVLTTGVPSFDPFDTTVIEYARTFDDRFWPKQQVGIQFVLIDHDPERVEVFRDLDDDAPVRNSVRLVSVL
jgi:hypothetical protein